LREQFYIIQAEVKLKQGRKSWAPDQVDALKWAETVFEKMDPHTREDIQKFQEKLEKIDKELDKLNKQVLTTHVEFYAIKEEYTQLLDKKSAYEQAYACMSEQLKQKKQGKSWKIKDLLSSSKFNIVSKSSSKKDKMKSQRHSTALVQPQQSQQINSNFQHL
jgi:septal ring factor EnvC (AmiA/AmiB activator)